jgi:hypothetical protein
MEYLMKRLSILILACALFFSSQEPHAGDMIVGVNVTNNDGSVSTSFQDEEIKQLIESHVIAIRIGLASFNVDFIIKAHQHGIGSIVMVMPFLGAKGWSDIVYSKTTPEVFAQRIKPILDKLEAAGVRLTAFELGNEINNSQFNGDLPADGKGRELRLADLNNSNDAQAAQVAIGYKAYVRLLATMKDLRDHSKLNQHTPIITGGLSQVHSTPFEVDLRDAIAFFNQNGAGKLVDGHGLHVYPSGDPKRPVSARIASFNETMFSACRLASKPCWITEWGFHNDGQNRKYCADNNAVITQIVRDMRMTFKYFSTRGELAGVMYFDWTSRPGGEDPFSLFRCGALSDYGKLAVSPM